jgi:hypothetical protein
LFERQLVFEGAVNVTDVHVCFGTSAPGHGRVGIFERCDVGREDKRVPPTAGSVNSRVNVERGTSEEQSVSDGDW